MKTGEPGLRARAVFRSEAAFRALQKSHRGRRDESRPRAPPAINVLKDIRRTPWLSLTNSFPASV
jgi:hypothetical protein